MTPSRFISVMTLSRFINIDWDWKSKKKEIVDKGSSNDPQWPIERIVKASW